MISISQATDEDLQRCGPCAKKFFGSSEHLKHFELSRFVQTWTTLLSTGAAVIYLATQGEDVVGAIGGVCHPDPYCQDLIAQEMFWFVSPEARGKVGVRLYKLLEAWARMKGCSDLRMAFLGDSKKAASMDRFYVRMGFKAVDINYSKELK